MTNTVTYSAFYTRNLQNFENAKIGYELSSDEQKSGESLEDFRNRIKSKVQAWVAEDIEEIDREAAGR